jgi:hypothetical protein
MAFFNRKALYRKKRTTSKSWSWKVLFNSLPDNPKFLSPLRGSKFKHFHPHPDPLPSRERELPVRGTSETLKVQSY